MFSFLVRDLRKFKEVKKQFDKASEEKEVAQVKNAQVARNKPHEVDEATNLLTTTRKCFRHISLDYVLQVSEVTWEESPEVTQGHTGVITTKPSSVFQINVLQSKKRLEILKSVRVTPRDKPFCDFK